MKRGTSIKKKKLSIKLNLPKLEKKLQQMKKELTKPQHKTNLEILTQNQKQTKLSSKQRLPEIRNLLLNKTMQTIEKIKLITKKTQIRERSRPNP